MGGGLMKAPVVEPDDPPEEPPEVPPEDVPPEDDPPELPPEVFPDDVPPDDVPPDAEPPPDDVVPSTVNGEPAVYEPPALVIVTGPVVAPAGTATETPQSEFTTSEVAATPLKVTLDVVVRLLPEIVTGVPTGP